MEKDKQARNPVPPEVYSEDYFLEECEGYRDFIEGGMSTRLLAGLRSIPITPGAKILDIACGRGEAASYLAERGARVWALDYAAAALRIAHNRLHATESDSRTLLLAANAKTLPFADRQFDYALMLDIVEHLYPSELDHALREAHRVLRPNGQLIAHTAPNLWYYQFGYPVFRLTERLRGRRLPTDPRQRFRYHSLVHVNEQSPRSLRQALILAGFRAKVWVDSERTEWQWMGRLSRAAGRLATGLPLLKWVTCGDIFAVAYKV